MRSGRANLTIFVIGALISGLIMFFVERHFLVKKLTELKVGVFWQLAIWILARFSIIFVICRTLGKLNFDEWLIRYFEKKEIKRKAKADFLAKQREQKIRELKEEIKDGYVPKAIQYTQDPFIFIADLAVPEQQISGITTETLLPRVAMLNGIEISVRKHSKSSVYCYLRHAIKSEDPDLVFVFRKNTVAAKNPYYLDTACTGEIRWQCEGHSNERMICIPSGYFPNADFETKIPFRVKVHKTIHGPYYGKLNVTKDTIVIDLDKEIHRADCEQKECSLVLDFGTKQKIVLPKPTVLVREGKKVSV